MDDDTLFTRLRLSVAHEQRLLGTHAPQGHVIEREGVVGSIVASVPESTLINAVVVLSPGTITSSVIDELHTAYTGAGVRKWGVWVDPQDADTLAAISAAGLVFDSHPTPMGAALADLDLDGDAPPADMPTQQEAGGVNDLAYGHTDARIERVFGALAPDIARSYGTRDDDGELVSVVSVVEHEQDAAVWMVATVPWARNQGHAKRLMRRALLDARERGCTTTTLLASQLGAPVYEALGYRELGEFHLWERRP